MSDDLTKNMAILMGKGGPITSQEITEADKKKLSDAYSDLFFGLAGANWARDMTLGAAWYHALKQISGMIGAKDKNNPAAMYLNQVFAAHRAKWSQVIMTHSEKDKPMEMSADAKQKWSSDRAKQIGDAMAVINVFILKYKAPTADSAMIQAAITQFDHEKALRIMKADQNINKR